MNALSLWLFLIASASAQITCESTRSGNWSSRRVWTPRPPTSVDHAVVKHAITADEGKAKSVTVAAGGSLHIHGDLALHDGSLTVHGKLTGDLGTVAFHVSDDRLFTGGVKPGPVPGEPDYHPDDYGLWAMPGSAIELDGGGKVAWASCTPLTQPLEGQYGLFASAAFATGRCTLDRDVGWTVGDRLLLANEKGASALATLVAIDGRRITYSGADDFAGEVLTYGGKTISPKVANLSRKLRFVSAGVAEGDTNHRAHCAFLHGSTAHIRGVELRNFGPRGKLGRYPIHWHMGGATSGTLDSCSIWQDVSEPGNRFVAVHHVQGVTIKDNVAFRGRGHGYFLEDRHEVGNRLLRNLSVAVEAGEELNNVDSAATKLTHHFWVRIANEVTDNVAIGGSALGIVVLKACPGCATQYLPTGQRPVVSGQHCYGVGKYGIWSQVADVDFANCVATHCLLAGVAGDAAWDHSSNGVRVVDSLLALNGNLSGDPYVSQVYLNGAKDMRIENSALLGRKGVHAHYNVRAALDQCSINVGTLYTPTYWESDLAITGSQIVAPVPFDRAYPPRQFQIGRLTIVETTYALGPLIGGEPLTFIRMAYQATTPGIEFGVGQGKAWLVK
jgi:hypothetical protein